MYLPPNVYFTLSILVAETLVDIDELAFLQKLANYLNVSADTLYVTSIVSASTQIELYIPAPVPTSVESKLSESTLASLTSALDLFVLSFTGMEQQYITDTRGSYIVILASSILCTSLMFTICAVYAFVRDVDTFK
jgi:hypothetical protein